MKKLQQTRHRCNIGQAVVEYAAAMVLATMLVALVITVVPGDFLTYFDHILTGFAGMVVEYLP